MVWSFVDCFFMYIKNINSLRALFGADLTKNAVHGSSDPDKAKDAIKMIFGDVKLETDISKSPPTAGLFVIVTIILFYLWLQMRPLLMIMLHQVTVLMCIV